MLSNILSNTFGNLITILGIIILAALVLILGALAVCVVRLAWNACSDVISKSRTNGDGKHEQKK